jgi:hypothetical protein
MNPALVVATILSAGPCLAAPLTAQQTACATAALYDYTRSNLALLSAAPLMSVESTIAQRRLQEQYCLRFAQCVIGGANYQSPLVYAVEFSTCLRDEAAEQNK